MPHGRGWYELGYITSRRGGGRRILVRSWSGRGDEVPCYWRDSGCAYECFDRLFVEDANGRRRAGTHLAEADGSRYGYAADAARRA